MAIIGEAPPYDHLAIAKDRQGPEARRQPMSVLLRRALEDMVDHARRHFPAELQHEVVAAEDLLKRAEEFYGKRT